jgi:hypothetical protein
MQRSGMTTSQLLCPSSPSRAKAPSLSLSPFSAPWLRSACPADALALCLLDGAADRAGDAAAVQSRGASTLQVDLSLDVPSRQCVGVAEGAPSRGVELEEGGRDAGSLLDEELRLMDAARGCR